MQIKNAGLNISLNGLIINSRLNYYLDTNLKSIARFSWTLILDFWYGLWTHILKIQELQPNYMYIVENSRLNNYCLVDIQELPIELLILNL